MTNELQCCCCKTNSVGKSTVMCENCWKWHEEEITFQDVAVILGMMYNTERETAESRKISQYLVANNYTQGKSELR